MLQLRDAPRESRNLTYVFITHDLGVVRNIAERVAVFERGSLVEEGETEAIFERPANSYTRSLIGAIPIITDDEEALLVEARKLGQLRLGSNEIHPDAWLPIIVRDPADTYAALSAIAGPRYSYSQLDDATELISRTLESVAEVSRIQAWTARTPSDVPSWLSSSSS